MASSGIDYAAFNKEIIAEFRANKGVVGGVFEGSLIALITTKGARSGKDRVSPLVYAWDGDRMFIAATYAGSDRNPAWYHNLIATPDLTVEVGTDAFEAVAVQVTGDERDRLFALMVEANPQLGTYGTMTSREIPVFVIERKSP
jgi:deazaflavin-dependent oxidoreductase (nitroreductase family)